MADKKDDGGGKKADGVGRAMLKGGVAFGLVAVPAFGGQVLSAVLKSKSEMASDLSEGTIGEAFMDGVSALPFVALEVGIAAAMGGKRSALRVLPLAVGGALLSGALPMVDRGIDRLIGGMLGDDATRALPSSTTAGQLPATTAAQRVPAGDRDAIGEVLPGGDRDAIGEVLPGGAMRGNAQY